MEKAVWGLIIVAIVSWGICYIYSTNIIHFGWIGTLFASTAGLIATISSYHTEDVAHTRGGTIYKAESPIKFRAIVESGVRGVGKRQEKAVAIEGECCFSR
ncbi:hypothetical protein JCM10599A_17490 [Paraburkholderia kururiensis]